MIVDGSGIYFVGDPDSLSTNEVKETKKKA